MLCAGHSLCCDIIYIVQGIYYIYRETIDYIYIVYSHYFSVCTMCTLYKVLDLCVYMPFGIYAMYVLMYVVFFHT